MIIQWKKYIFTINDIYGSADETKQIPKADLHAYFQQSQQIEAEKWYTLHKQVLTLCIDLHKTEEKLRKEQNRTTRYQINKATRDELSIHQITNPSNEDITEFIAFFNPFAEVKGIEKCREDKVKALQRSGGKLVITYVYHKDGRKLASHLYIIDGKRATMLYSCSGRFANTDILKIEVGRANRYLHWHDILFFKEKEYRFYDFLGLSINEEDIDQQNINKFKKGFGGKEVIQYQSFIPKTFRGFFMALLLKLKWRNQRELIRRNVMPIDKLQLK